MMYQNRIPPACVVWLLINDSDSSDAVQDNL